MKLDRHCRRPLRHRRPPRRMRRSDSSDERRESAAEATQRSTSTAAPSRMALAADPGNARPAVVGGQRRCSRSTSSPTTRWSASTPRPARSSPSSPPTGRSTARPSRFTLDRRHHLRRRQRRSPPTDVADNIAYVGDPKNKSPFLGTFLPVGATAKADDAAGTVTLTLAAPAPFVLNGLASLPIVCAGGHRRPQVAGAGHRRAPAPTSSPRPRPATTTPTRSATATPGARTAPRPPTKGMPATIVMKIVAERDHLGEPAALRRRSTPPRSIGPDAERLEAAGLFSTETPGAASASSGTTTPRAARPATPTSGWR